MTGGRRCTGRRHRGHTLVEPGPWLSETLTDAANAHEPDSARIRGRVVGPGRETRPPLAHAAGRRSESPDRLPRDQRRRQGLERQGLERTAPRGRRPERPPAVSSRSVTITLGAVVGVLGVVAITLIGIRTVPSRNNDHSMSATALPVPPPASATGVTLPLPIPSQQPASAGPTSQTTPDPAAAPPSPRTPADKAPRVQLSVGPTPLERIILPTPGARDWVLYGNGANRSAERVRANLAEPIIGRLNVSGSDPTVVAATSRFDWSAGSPQRTGRNYADALALRDSGRFRLAVPTAGQAGRLSLYLGTLGVRGVVRADIDGQDVSSVVVQSGHSSRWVGSVVEIDFDPGSSGGILTVEVSARAEPDSDDADDRDYSNNRDEQDERRDPDGRGSPGGGRLSRPQQVQAAPPGQISLAAAVLSGRR
ncbi:hypothetical protein [Candidatus Protofrankia datiscae]|uniref:Uncharacterized protein n=1 Tax=Candidatus Protofrankia datiscae TaxID=2716812 RepID=F8AV94_9ACTN|nr:hypothetical protein [Candidatus Protofrankia datiscae]AEH08186.1 hypothetical protein FsymDg_0661 [Candidatus Protofrankia datiscae]